MPRGRPKKNNPFLDETQAKQEEKQETKPEVSQASPTNGAVSDKPRKKLGYEIYTKEEKTIMCHKYKLTPANMKKNIGIDSPDFQPTYTDLIHTHIYNSVDSKGKEQIITHEVGGHFHTVEVENVEGRAPEVKITSGPLKWAKKAYRDKTGKKKYKTIMVDANEVDHHTHDVESYLGYSKVVQVVNPEAQKAIAFWQNKLKKPDEKEFMRKETHIEGPKL